MSLRGKKLGLLFSLRPERPNFQRGLCLAEAAMALGVEVYMYCIDEAVHGVADSRLQTLKARGLKLYACAYGAQRRGLPHNDQAVYAGLTMVSEIMAATDRFISLNG